MYYSTDPTLSCEERHKIWLDNIRKAVADRIVNEEERVPSYTALWRHWLRSSWVIKYWRNSHLNDVYSELPQPDDCGWMKQPNGSYCIEWEAPEVLQKIQTTIDFLLKGCGCKKGCKTKSCGCRKRQTLCGPGCECRGCTNVPTKQCNGEQSDEARQEREQSDEVRQEREQSDEARQEREQSDVLTHEEDNEYEDDDTDDDSATSTADYESDLEDIETEIVTDFPFTVDIV